MKAVLIANLLPADKLMQHGNACYILKHQSK